MLPANVEYSIYHDMAKIPAFDDGNTIPDAVAVFRKLINVTFYSDKVYRCRLPNEVILQHVPGNIHLLQCYR